MNLQRPWPWLVLLKIPALALAVPAALTLGADPALANCTQTGTIVNCTAPGTSGIVVAGDNAVVTVQPGTTVVDDGTRAIEINNNSTVTNSGTVRAVTNNSQGILTNAASGDNNTIVNNGTITSEGDQAQGVTLNGSGNTFTNSASGTITQSGAIGSGVASGGNNTIINAGTVVVAGASDAGNSTFAAGIALNIDDVAINSGTITITAADSIGIFTQGSNANITNSGTINANAAGSTGIFAQSSTLLTNTGTINAAGAGSKGVDFRSSGTGTFTNSGNIFATGTSAEAVHIGGTGSAGGNIAIVNNGLLQATGTTSFALRSQSVFGGAPSGANITNNAIVNGRIALSAGEDVLTNAGQITISSSSIPIATGVFTIDFGDFVQTASGLLSLRVTSAAATRDSFTLTTGGTATLAGTLRANVQAGLYGTTTVYANVLTAAGGRTGTFGSVVSSSPFFTASAAYTGTDVNLTLTRIGFGAVSGLTPNQQAVGNALNPGYATTLTGNAATLYSNLLAATSVTVLDRLSGEGTSAAQTAAFNAGSLFNNAMQGQGLFGPNLNGLSAVVPAQYADARPPGHEAFAALKGPPAAEPGRWRIWTAGFGANNSMRGESSTGSYSQSIQSAGGAIGAEWQVATDLRVGAAAGASESMFAVRDLTTSGRTTGGHIGFYAVKHWSAYYAAASVSYARFDNSTSRTIAGIGNTEHASGRFAGDQLGARLEIGRKHNLGPTNVTPFVAIEPTVLWQRAYTESSGGPGGSNGILGLTVASRTATSLPTFIGVQFDGRHITSEGAVLAPYSRVSWVHEFEPDRRVTGSFVTLPGATFTVDGARAASDAARLDTGARLAFRGGQALFANFGGEWSGRTQSYAATGGFRAGW